MPITIADTLQPGGPYAVAHMEDVWSKAGTPIAKLFRQISANDLQNVVYLSETGDDASDGRTADSAKATWAAAARIAEVDSKILIIPDSSVIAAATPLVDITVIANHGSRITGDLTVKGTWYVGDIGLAVGTGTLTLGEDCQLHAQRIDGDLVLDQTSGVTHSKTWAKVPRVTGDLTIVGTGDVYVYVDQVDGTATVTPSSTLDVHGWVEDKRYGIDLAHADLVAQDIMGKDATFEELTVTGNINNAALTTRVDAIEKAATTTFAIPAGEYLPARSPLVVANTAAGSRMFRAKDVVGSEVLAKREVFDAARVTSDRWVDDLYIHKRPLALPAHTQTQAIAAGEKFGVLVVGAEGEIDARTFSPPLIDQPPAWDPARDSPEGDVITSFAYGLPSSSDTVYAIDVAFYDDYNFYVFCTISDSYSHATRKVYAVRGEVQANSGRIVWHGQKPEEITAVPPSTYLRVVYSHAHQSFYLLLSEDRGNNTRTYYIHALYRNQLGRWVSRDNASFTGATSPDVSMYSLGLAIHGDHLLVLTPAAPATTNPSASDLRSHLTSFEITATGMLTVENVPSASPLWAETTNRDLYTWTMETDGEHLFVLAKGDSSKGVVLLAYELSSFDLVLEHTLPNVFADGASHLALAFDSQTVTLQATVAVLTNTTQAVHLAAFQTPIVPRSFKAPVAISGNKSTTPGQIPPLAHDGQVIGGLTGLAPGQIYYVHSNGLIDTVISEAPLYTALTDTEAIVSLFARGPLVRANNDLIQAVAPRVDELALHHATFVAGEQLDAGKPVSIGSDGLAVRAREQSTSHGMVDYPIYDTSDIGLKVEIVDAHVDRRFEGSSATSQASCLSIGPDGRAIFARIAARGQPITLNYARVYSTSVSAYSSNSVSTNDALRAQDFSYVDEFPPYERDVDNIQIVWTGVDSAEIFYYNRGRVAVRMRGLTINDGPIDAAVTIDIGEEFDVLASGNLEVARFTWLEEVRTIVGVLTRSNSSRAFLFTLAVNSSGHVSSSTPLHSSGFLIEYRDSMGLVGSGNEVTIFYPYLSGSSYRFKVGRLTVNQSGVMSSFNRTGGGVNGIAVEMNHWNVFGRGNHYYLVGYDTSAPHQENIRPFTLANSGVTALTVTEGTVKANVFHRGPDPGTRTYPSLSYNELNGCLEMSLLDGDKTWKSQLQLDLVSASISDLVGVAHKDTHALQEVGVLGYGGVIKNLNGLTPGRQYYVRSDGSVSNTNSGDANAVKLYRALGTDSAHLNFDIPDGATS